jgi:hypothetical protein
MSFKLRLGVAAVSALTVLVTLAPRHADAVTKRSHGSMCHILTGTQGTTSEGIFGIWNNSASMSLLCPIMESSDLARNAITEVNVYGFDNDVSLGVPWVGAKACRSYSTSDGGTCGAGTTVGQQNFVLSPALTAWTTTTGFAYVYVYGMQSADDVRGIYYHD